MKHVHDMPFGAHCLPEGRVRFRLWAPQRQSVEVCICRGGDTQRAESLAMEKLPESWFELVTEKVSSGSRYKFRLDGGISVPDPASRFQPEDVHGPSEVVDAASFDWQDDAWRGLPWNAAVIYELHVGAFTPEGTFLAAEQKLDYLAELGVTALELMPVADSPGARNWGYDGVLPFAPDSRYGRPSDLKRLIQSAHAKGLMVFLDVVYNHFGPEGNHLGEYAPQFFTRDHPTPWGQAINYGNRTVRDFFVHNSVYWLTEYRFDGLRLDAVDTIFDESPRHILTELAETVRGAVGPGRHVHLVLENDRNAARYLERDANGSAKLYDAQWNDDIHHALHTAITKECSGYYADYCDQPLKRLGRCLTEGFDYQGQASVFRSGAVRGEPSRHLLPQAFVSFLQNHDQVGNRAFGERIGKLANAKAIRAATVILFLSPQPLLMLMGQEFGAELPFLFFCDFGPDLAAAVTEGRRREFERFPEFADPELRSRIPDPSAVQTFLSSKLDWNCLDRSPHDEWLNFHRELLLIRRREIVPLLPKIQSGGATFEIFGCGGLLAHWPLTKAGQLSLLANLSDEGVEPPEIPCGILLYATGLTPGQLLRKERRLPPWTAAWFLTQ